MPISSDEFEEGTLCAPGTYLLELFKRNSITAFSVADLLKISKEKGRNFSKEELEGALFRLMEGKKIKSKDIEGVTYYLYIRIPLGFRRG